MGSWGIGLQDNDDAAQVIGIYKRRLEGIARTKKASARRKKTETLFSDLLSEGLLNSSPCILGIADYLLDARVELSGIGCITVALELERRAESLAGWVDDEGRVEVLNNFADRLAGRKVPKTNPTPKPKEDASAELITRLEEAQSMLKAATRGALIPACFHDWEKIAEKTIKKSKPGWKEWPC